MANENTGATTSTLAGNSGMESKSEAYGFEKITDKQLVTTIGKSTTEGYFMVDPDLFITPRLSDFQNGDVSVKYLDETVDSVKNNLNKSSSPTFYREQPPVNGLGYFPDLNVFVVKAELDLQNGPTDPMHTIDGDTAYFLLDKVIDNGEAFTIDDIKYSSVKEYMYKFMQKEQSFDSNVMKYLNFGIRCVAYDAPEIVHYSAIPVDKDYYEKGKEIVTLTREEAMKKEIDTFYFEKNSSITPIHFIPITSYDADYDRIRTKYHQIIEATLKDVNTETGIKHVYVIKYVNVDASDFDPDYAKQATGARNMMMDCLLNAKEIRVVLDHKSVNKQGISYPKYDLGQTFSKWIKDPIAFWSQQLKFGSAGYYRHFNAPGQDLYKRFIGAIYVLDKSDNWINVGKKICASFDKCKVNKTWVDDPILSQLNNGVADVFKSWSYDFKRIKVIDSLEELSKKLDDRKDIQKKITGFDIESLKDHTVMIGDCLFMVPPTSIRVVTQNTSERLKTIRSKGSMTKGTPHYERKIELSLFFNNDHGINGTPYPTTLPNGNQVTYYMNGLRALIAMFKLTPFMPIDNDYINNILNIEAVSLVSLQLTTMPSYPSCIAVSLVLEEFNYRIYMPEIPKPDTSKGEDPYKNLFASTISFEVMRWYYQRLLFAGDTLRNIDASASEYITKTFGERTALQPMRFGDSYVKFYIPNKEDLDKKLQAKINAMSTPLQNIPEITASGQEVMKQLSVVYGAVKRVMGSTAIQSILEGLNHQDKETHLAIEDNFTNINLMQSDNVMEKTVTIKYKGSPYKKGPASRNANNLSVDYLYTQQEMIKTFFDPLAERLRSELVGKAPLISGVELSEETVKANMNMIDVILKVNLKLQNLFLTEVDKQAFAKLMNYELDTVENFFTGDNLELSFSAQFKDELFGENTKPYTFDLNCLGMKLLATCATNAGIMTQQELSDSNKWDVATASLEMQRNQQKNKQATDIDYNNSLQFEEYPIGDVKITNLSCSMGNTMSKISLTGFEGYAPQFMGGQDTVIEVTMQTKDQATVAIINQIPILSASYIRQYKLILKSCPLRIDSEITRLFGVHEVLVETVDVNTVPNQPGLYTINMRLVSVDRTQRNKEALQKIKVANNSGARGQNQANTYVFKEFWEINESLANVEIYPDLELPTLDDMEKAGFKMVRHTALSGRRKYPDPDFYFIYGHVLGSELYREIITENIYKNKVSEMMMQLDDSTGSSITIKPKETEGYEVLEDRTNVTAELIKQRQKKLQQEIDAVFQKVKSDASTPSDLPYSTLLEMVMDLDTKRGWDISDNIKCIFREPIYNIENAVENEKDLAMYNNKLARLAEIKAKLITLIDKELSQPIKKIKDAKEVLGHPEKYVYSGAPVQGYAANKGYFGFSVLEEYGNLSHQQDLMRDAITEFVRDFFRTEGSVGYDIATILEVFEVMSASSESFRNSMIGLLMAAAAAATGDQECDGNNSSLSWRGKIFRISNPNNKGKTADKDPSQNKPRPVPIAIIEKTGQGITGLYQAASLYDAMKEGTSFGPYLIQNYYKKDIIEITAEEFKGDSMNLNARYFIDPFYRGLDPESAAVKAYKYYNLVDPYVATHAFVRNMLYWMKKMLEDDLTPSLYDVMADEIAEALDTKLDSEVVSTSTSYRGERQWKKIMEKKMKEKATIPGNTTAEEEALKIEEESKTMAKSVKDIIQKSEKPIAIGRFYVPIALALNPKDDSLFEMIRSRNYTALNEMTRQFMTVDSDYIQSNPAIRSLRKFSKALVGYNIIDSVEDFGKQNEYASETLESIMTQKIYLKQAEDPNVYLFDSFYDMITNDKRGRMSRAFPVFYMLMIDEGRDIGIWHLHDNFYNTSAISELQVTKSRKIAADTAHIVMSNMFSTYTTDDEDIKDGYTYSFKDAWNSIFSPRTLFKTEELRRMAQQNVNKIKLQPGIRLHIRLGYSADASQLPTVFNGVVAEVSAGEAIEIVAQGDGVELANPIMSNIDGEDMQNEDDFILSKLMKNWLTEGETPKNIMASILTTRGGFMRKQIHKLSNSRFFNENPYGITHFGDPFFQKIFSMGEGVQNIYEATSKPSWGGSAVSEAYKTEGAPKISMHLFGKSFWDVMQMSAAVSPDFIASVVPFGLRSSVFYGAPRYYCAYEYVIDAFGNVKEKRKPFQQYHIYTSYSDIMGNAIKTSDRDVRTCAVGLYTATGWLGREHPKRVGPMWVDFDIYPEKQKTMTVDTQFIAKGNALGDIIPLVNTIANELTQKDGGFFQNGYQIAWRMTASALKNSVKDMYQGELIVVGDPSVKPYDKIWFSDILERMQGAVEAEAVVHNLSVETGYSTSVFVDCIATIDDRHEQISNSILNGTIAHAVAAYSLLVAPSWAFTHHSKPILTAVSKWIKTGTNMANKSLDTMLKVIGKDQMLASEGSIVKALQGAGKGVDKLLGVNEIDILLSNIKTWEYSMGAIKNPDDLAGLAKYYDRMSKTMNKIDAENVLGTLSQSDKAKAKELSKTIGEFNDGALAAANKAKLTHAELEALEDNLARIRALLPEGSERLLEIDKALENVAHLKTSTAVKMVDVSADTARTAQVLRAVGTEAEDVAGVTVKNLIARSIGSVNTFKSGVGAAAEGITSNITRLYRISNSVIATTTAATWLAATALEFAVVEIITQFAVEFVERWMKNLQVLQIFPIRKDGKVYTAGLDGSRGVVVGSPTETDPGLIEGAIGNLFAYKEGNGFSLKNLMLDFFATQDMKDIASKYRAQNNIPEPDSRVEGEKQKQDLLKAVAGDSIEATSSYRALLLKPRVLQLKSVDGQKAYTNYALKDTKDIAVNQTIAEDFVPIMKSLTISKLKTAGKLRLNHITPIGNIDKPNYKHGSLPIKINGIQSDYPVIYDNKVVDIPFLRPEAFAVLTEIVDRLVKKLSVKPYKEDYLKTHNIIIRSATRIGDPSWMATGFVFRISVEGFDGLGTFLEKFQKEQTEVIEKLNFGDDSDDKLFSYQKVIGIKEAYDILVYPPKV